MDELVSSRPQDISFLQLKAHNLLTEFRFTLLQRCTITRSPPGMCVLPLNNGRITLSVKLVFQTSVTVEGYANNFNTKEKNHLKCKFLM